MQDVTIGEGGGHGNPLQYSCLQNSMDRGAWWTIVHRIMKSQIRLKQLSSSSSSNSVPKGFLGGSAVKNPPAVQEQQETWVRSLGPEDPEEEGMAIHSSIFVWRIPWTEKPRGLQTMGSQRVGHD